MMTSGPKMLFLAMSGSIVLPNLRSVLMPVVYVITGAHENHVLNHVMRYESLTELGTLTIGMKELAPPLT